MLFHPSELSHSSPLHQVNDPLVIQQGFIRQGFIIQGFIRQGSIRQSFIRQGFIRQGFIRQGFIRQGSIRQGIIKLSIQNCTSSKLVINHGGIHFSNQSISLKAWTGRKDGLIAFSRVMYRNSSGIRTWFADFSF